MSYKSPLETRLAKKVTKAIAEYSLIEDGDHIDIDPERRRIDIGVSAETLAKRRAQWRAPAPRYTGGVFAKYAQLVASASNGAITGSR